MVLFATSDSYSDAEVGRLLVEVAGVDFTQLARQGRTLAVTVTQTEDGPMTFDVTIRTHVIAQGAAASALRGALTDE